MVAVSCTFKRVQEIGEQSENAVVRVVRGTPLIVYRYRNDNMRRSETRPAKCAPFFRTSRAARLAVKDCPGQKRAGGDIVRLAGELAEKGIVSGVVFTVRS